MLDVHLGVAGGRPRGADDAMRLNGIEKVFLAGLAVIALVIVFLIVGCTVAAKTDADCKAKGWREGNVTWNLKRWCVTRIDQTDVVVPLSEAGNR